MPFTVEGLHHVGLSVRDIRASFEWYSKMFGLEHGPINEGAGQALSDSVQVEGTELSFSMLTIGSTRIEFLEYHRPRGDDFDRGNNDIGSAHLCLQVDDLEVAYRELQERGAVFNAPPVTLTDGDVAGSVWAYLRDPDGIQLEIWQNPKKE